MHKTIKPAEAVVEACKTINNVAQIYPYTQYYYINV